MKSYAQDPNQMLMPSGAAFPRAPVPQQLFYLTRDLPDIDENEHVTNPWYCRGAYVYNGLHWLRLTDGGREVKSSTISSNILEVESPTSPMNEPVLGQGFNLAEISITPANRKARFSGTASVWVDVSRNANVWLSVFRDRKLISVVLEHITAGQPRTMAISFVDLPFTWTAVPYTLTLNSDVIKSMGNEYGMVYVNRSKLYTFEGRSQTAFQVNENTVM